ncbi:pirin family protein [Paraoerskovia sediminicola]|nr:pirin family protein [Paraoerskovia sediminicola]
MSNQERDPDERLCSAGDPRAGIEVLTHRDVPLGGPRAMDVRRTIPQRARSLVGAWCFCDHYGPDDVSRGPGMQVPPHPHTGLQTVTWLFEGEVLHRDSLRSLETVRPGELNLMTAGRGISHSEETPRGSREARLHGVQLWVALPSSRAGGPPAFEHRSNLPTVLALGARVEVFVGSLGLGGRVVTSPAMVHTPLVGAQVDLDPGSEVTLDVSEGFEHGLLVDAGDVTLEGVRVPPSSLAYVGTGRTSLTVAASSDGPARMILLGGEPFEEDVVMWWNFVGRTHEDVAEARAAWSAQLATGSRDSDGSGGSGGADGSGGSDGSDAPDGRVTGFVEGADEMRFGETVGYDGPPLPAPRLPDVRLRPRRRA